MTSTTRPAPSRRSQEPLPEGRLPDVALATVRVLVAFLWMSGAAWKVPPDFGRERGVGLWRWTNLAVEHPVLAPYTWAVEHVVLPSFGFFGWVVLLTESALGAFLLAGLLTRVFALVGIAQTLAIMGSVLHAPGEWPWSYYLMLAVHVVLLAFAAGRVYGADGLLRQRWRHDLAVHPDRRVPRALLAVT